ncbi:MAG: condensation domain-containing protein [Flavobacteriales bacterium]
MMTTDSVYPLSIIQRRFYDLARSRQGHICNNYLMQNVIRGKLDLPALENAFKKIIERHEVLRTSFFEEKGIVWQRIHPSVSFSITMHEIESGAGQIEAMHAFSEKERGSYFDLQSVPFLKVSVALLAEDSFFLTIRVHHMTMDAASMMIFFNELNLLYVHYSTNSKLTLPEPSAKYYNHCLQQQKRFLSPAALKSKAFLLDYLKGVYGPGLPLDASAPKQRTFNGSSEVFFIESQKFKQINTYLGNHSSRPGLFAFFVSMVNLLIYSKSASKDFFVRFPFSDRKWEDNYEDCFGCFIGTLPIRSKIEGNLLFSEYLTAMNREVKSMLRHRVYPFEKLVEDLPQKDERLTHFPVNTVVNIKPFETYQVKLGDLEVIPFKYRAKQSKFDFLIEFIVDEPSSIEVFVEYNTDLFKKRTIKKWCADFRHMLDLVLSHDMPLKDYEAHLSLLEKEEVI